MDDKQVASLLERSKQLHERSRNINERDMARKQIRMKVTDVEFAEFKAAAVFSGISIEELLGCLVREFLRKGREQRGRG